MAVHPARYYFPGPFEQFPVPCAGPGHYITSLSLEGCYQMITNRT
jgi:hypothetical protein